MIYPKQLLDLANNIKNHGQGIDIWEDDTEHIDHFVNQQEKYKEGFQRSISFKEKMLKKKGFLFSSELERRILYLFSAALKWKWRGMEAGILEGGFAFQGIIDTIAFSNDFWEKGLKHYKDYEEVTTTEEELIEQLKWFETYEYPTTTNVIHSYGCILYEKGVFPNTFYFYSSGLAYLLPFKTFDEYINALITACGVRYWQYFYIDPELLIFRNKDKNYITHGTHFRTLLEERSRKRRYNPNTQINRLDLIHEYLKRCVDSLPTIFPFADFTHHQNYYTRFKELYEASKKE